MTPNLTLANDPIAELETEALAKRGTANQRERYAASLLPEGELLAIARAELFAPLADFGSWHNRYLKSGAVQHNDSPLNRCRGVVEFETCEATELSHDQWDVLARVRHAADLAADHHWVQRSVRFTPEGRSSLTVEPLAHWATCKACHAETVRSSVKVSIWWAGRLLTREYAL